MYSEVQQICWQVRCKCLLRLLPGHSAAYASAEFRDLIRTAAAFLRGIPGQNKANK